MKQFLIALVIVLSGTWSEARACYIPPESDHARAQRELDWQNRATTEAAVIYVARLTRHRDLGERVHGRRPHAYEVTLRPTIALKGTRPRGDLIIHVEDANSCGYAPGWDAIYGRRGDLFVIFSTAVVPTQASILDANRIGDVVQPDLAAQLAAIYR